MRKLIGRFAATLAVAAVATAAAGLAAPRAAWADVIKPTSWEDEGLVELDYKTRVIYVGAGDTLDLSDIEDSPSEETFIRVAGNNATIVGNPDMAFDNLYLTVWTNNDDNDDGAFEDDDVTVNLENFCATTERSADLFYSIVDIDTASSSWTPELLPQTATFSYKGKNSLWAAYGTRDLTTAVIFKAQEGSSLDIGVDTWGDGSSAAGVIDGSLTFDGGTVTSTPIQYYNPSRDAGLHITGGCDLLIATDAEDYGIEFHQVDHHDDREGVQHDNPDSQGSITIDDGARVRIEVMTPISSSVSGIAPGGITGGDAIVIDGATVEVVCTQPGYTGIGYAGEIKIVDGAQVSARVNTVKSESDPSTRVRDAGIGGDFNTMTIENSTVVAEAYRGAAIGKRAARAKWGEPGTEGYGSVQDWYTRYLYPEESAGYKPLTQAITISNSTVEASSVYGAGIGSGGHCDWVGSVTNVTISGTSKVTARSLYGAGIGAGVAKVDDAVMPGIPLGGVSTDPSSEWDETLDSSGSAYQSLSLASAKAASARAADDQDANELGRDVGTLTIEGSPTICAESGTRGVSLAVKAGAPMMQYTLNEYVAVATPINRAAVSGEDTGTGAPSYSLQPGYRSLAFWPVAAGTYTLTYGSGENPDPLLDITGDNPAYATEYTIPAAGSGDALTSFNVARRLELGGKLVIKQNGAEVTGVAERNNWLTPDTGELLPASTRSSGAGYLTYTWYECQNDGTLEPVDAKDVSSNGALSTVDDGRYICKVAGTGIYRGEVVSAVVTVADQYSSINPPSAPTVSNPDKQITGSSITLDVEDDGWQYGIVTAGTDDTPQIAWRDTPEFTDLDSNRAYAFVQREGEDGEMSLSATFWTLAGRPAASDLTIDYVNETFSLATDVSAYKDSECTQKIYTTSLDGYIARDDAAAITVYLKYDDAATVEYTVTAVEIPKRPVAPSLESASIAATQTTISLKSGQGVVYALFDENDNLIQQIEGTGDTITFDDNGQDLVAGTTYKLRARKPAVAETEGVDGRFQSM